MWSAPAFAAALQVYWVSDPVGPGQAVMAIGDALGDRATLEVVRLADAVAGSPASAIFAWPGGGVKVEALQATDHSLKFVVPATLPPGVFAYRIATANGAATGLLNRPAIWWTQGDRGTSSSPGGSLQLFGKNLAASGAGGAAAVLLKGPRAPSGGSGPTPVSPLRTVALSAQGDAYEAAVALPADLPAGDYEVFLHNGRGGSGAWSESTVARVEKLAPWPQTIFNVKDFAAEGTGVKDDTTPVRAALAAAEKNGGGVVFFPRGRYLVSAMLSMPRLTVLRGEKRELVNLLWPDFPKPPEALVRGKNHFGLEDLTLCCANYKTIIAADTRTPDAGDVFLRRLRVRANLYYGHPEPEEVDRRYREGLKVGFGGGYWLAILGGRNVEVSDCDLYSASCVISLIEPRGARIQHNILGAGRWGGSGVFGGDGVVIADNKYVGCDLMSWGAAGGLGFGNLQHVFIRRNSFALEHGGDRESITSDSSGEVYHGRIASGDASGVTLPADVAQKTPPDLRDRMKGAAVFVIDGKGQGQWRVIARFEGPRIVVDRPWDVVPDATSTVATTYLLRRWLILDNDFSDTGVAVQIYGASLEHIIAGNRSARTAGFHNFGMNYGGVQPSWFVQWLDNEILEGNIFHADHDNHCLSGEAHLGVFGLVGAEWRLPITVGTVLRGNRLRNNARIALGNEMPAGAPVPGSRADPLVNDVIVEDNLVENNGVGVCVSRTAHGVLLRDNHFHNVQQPVWDEAAALAAAQQRLRELCAQRGPVAAWNGEKALVDGTDMTRFRDATGHGFDAVGPGVQSAPGGVHGKAIKFSGEGFLRADDAQIFNLPSFTLNLWIKPDTIAGRHGLIGKRWGGVASPLVLSLWDGRMEFEACDEADKWSFNFRSSAVVKAGVWSQLAAVVEAGKGVVLYCNGEVVARLDNPKKRCDNAEPLVFGREAWDGASDNRPCFYRGMMDGVKIWARPLSAGEVRAEYESGRPAK
jgi:hypothetical protein